MTALSGPLLPPLVGLAAGGATLFGGAIALRFRAVFDLFLAFSSGAVIGVALFDLLPEALGVGGTGFRPLTITTLVATGFSLYFTADRAAGVLGRGAQSPRRHFGPASLTAHSLMDGLGMGFAFQVSPSVGMVVAFAVLAHDLLDGANTVTLSLAGGANPATARAWLYADAAAPLLGVGLASLVVVPAAFLAGVLALFAGGFLYIGASELLPLSHDRRPKVSTIAATLSGLAFIYGVVRLASA